MAIGYGDGVLETLDIDYRRQDYFAWTWRRLSVVFSSFYSLLVVLRSYENSPRWLEIAAHNTCYRPCSGETALYGSSFCWDQWMFYWVVLIGWRILRYIYTTVYVYIMPALVRLKDQKPIITMKPSLFHYRWNLHLFFILSELPLNSSSFESSAAFL